MEDIRAIVTAFCEQCGWAWTIRNQYRVLYERSDQRLELLGHVANDYFSFMRSVLLDYLYLQFSRLTDPATQGPHTNLTAPFIANKLSWPPEIRERLRRHLQRLLAFRERVVIARSKHIAHVDLTAHLDGLPLGAFPEGEDDRFFESLQDFVNIAHDNVIGGPYPLNSVSHEDADSLVRYLREGVAFQRLWDQHPGMALELLDGSPYGDA